MTKLASVTIHTIPEFKELLAFSSLKIFWHMSFLLDFVITMSKGTIISKLAISVFEIAANFSLVLNLKIFLSSGLRRPGGF